MKEIKLKPYRCPACNYSLCQHIFENKDDDIDAMQCVICGFFMGELKDEALSILHQKSESPDHMVDDGKPIECDHVFDVCTGDEGTSHYGKCQKCGVEANDINADGGLKRKRDCKQLDCGRADTFCNDCIDHIAEDRKKVEEKPPIKLRVGQQFKMVPVREDSEETPTLQCQHCFKNTLLLSPWVWCNSHSLIYRNDYRHDAMCPTCAKDEEDLIEEVQPENEKSFNYEDFTNTIFESASKKYEEVSKFQEEIITAFIAKHGCDPEDVVVTIGPNEHWHIHKNDLEKELESLRKENAELKEKLQKPEGNPFKVGDVVDVCESNKHDGRIACWCNCKVTKTWGDSVELTAQSLGLVWYHYKQCEAVND